MKNGIEKMIDESIEIDVSLLPKSVQEEIHDLEILNEKEDWFSYDLKFYELESNAKGYIFNGQISEEIYTKLLEKYGRLYD